MKKLFFVLSIVFILSVSAFSETPNFIIEVSNAYAVGINLNNAYQLNARLYYPFGRFGLVLEAGNIFIQDNNLFNFFIAPVFFIIDTEKWRMPVAVGFDLMRGQNNFYYGIGGMVAAHYSFAKNFYVGVDLGITYAFDNKYDELTGHRTEAYTYVDNNGQPQLGTRDVPIFENKSHFGNYIYFKPSITIGFQF